MTQTIGWGLASAVLAMIVGVVTPAVGVHGPGENVEVNDLSELGDGETRTFGSGEDVVIATREGDVVKITLPRGDGDDARVIDCKLGGSTQCFAFSSGESAGVKMVIVDGDEPGELRKKVEVLHIGVGDHENLFHTADSRTIVLRGAGEPTAEVETLIGAGPHFKMLTLGHDQQIVRCPEGDTTMNLEKDDDLTYYCPKHNVELEKVEGHHAFKTIQILTEDGEDDDDLF